MKFDEVWKVKLRLTKSVVSEGCKMAGAGKRQEEDVA